MTLESHRIRTCSVDAVVEATESHGWVSETEAEGTLKHLLNAYCEDQARRARRDAIRERLWEVFEAEA